MPSDTTVGVLLGALGPGAIAIYAFLWNALWDRVASVLKTTRTEQLGMSKRELSTAYDAARGARVPGGILAIGAILVSVLCLPTAIPILSVVSPLHSFDVWRALFELLTLFWLGLAGWVILAVGRLWSRMVTLRKRVDRDDPL
jgi:hypothetical protein